MRPALALLALLLPALAGCTTPPPPPLADGPPPGDASILEAARAFEGQQAWNLAGAQLSKTCTPVPRGIPSLCAPLWRYRVTGSADNNATADMLAQRLREAGLAVRFDNFTATFEGRELPARNVVGERPGSGNRTLYLGAHYDTRPCADKDPDPGRRSEPVLGANDGASGVAVLLHLAELLRGRALNFTLRFVLFDAEDMGDGGLGCGRGTPWAQGSAHYAAALGQAEVDAAFGMVLVDLVGDPQAEFRREGRSAAAPHRALQDDLWAWAKKLGHGQFLDAPAAGIIDDHVAFQQRGIRSVDIIHLDDDGRDLFPDTHHTTFDDLDHVSAATLEAVGETVLAAVLAWDAEAGGAGAGQDGLK